LSRRGRRLPANASVFDTRRDSITSFGDVVQLANKRESELRVAVYQDRRCSLGEPAAGRFCHAGTKAWGRGGGGGGGLTH
jgi:hypothetical protein